jgi:hypothetical protein
MNRLTHLLSLTIDRWFIPRWRYEALERAYDDARARNLELAKRNVVLVAKLCAVDPQGLRIKRDAA